MRQIHKWLYGIQHHLGTIMSNPNDLDLMHLQVIQIGDLANKILEAIKVKKDNLKLEKELHAHS